jgi:hypothetical protein
LPQNSQKSKTSGPASHSLTNNRFFQHPFLLRALAFKGLEDLQASEYLEGRKKENRTHQNAVSDTKFGVCE